MPWIAVKHGKHNQLSHGRKGKAGQAGASAYSAARASGASVTEARAAARTAVQETRAQEKADAQAARVKKLTDQAAHYRQLAEGNATEAQKRRYAERAAALEARARGEKVPTKEKATPVLSRDEALKAEAAAARAKILAHTTPYDAEVRDLEQQVRVLSAEYEASTKRLDTSLQEANAIRLERDRIPDRNNPRYIELSKREAELRDQDSLEYKWRITQNTRMEALKKQLSDAKERQTRDYLQFTQVSHPITIQSTYINSFPKKTQLRINQAIQDTASLIGRSDIQTLTVDILANKKSRAHAKNKREIALNSTGDQRTTVHEVAHILELNNPAVYQAAGNFWARRTQGEKTQPLHSLTNRNYRSEEVARADHFLDPYVGKVYPSHMGATEIISMGLEYMYAEPVRLARDDPDYFDFIYTTMRK